MPMPCGAGVGGRPELDGLAVDEHLALLRVVDAVEHLHQRALAGAVLAEQGVHLAGVQIESRRASLATRSPKRCVMPAGVEDRGA